MGLVLSGGGSVREGQARGDWHALAAWTHGLKAPLVLPSLGPVLNGSFLCPGWGAGVCLAFDAPSLHILPLLLPLPVAQEGPLAASSSTWPRRPSWPDPQWPPSSQRPPRQASLPSPPMVSPPCPSHTTPPPSHPPLPSPESAQSPLLPAWRLTPPSAPRLVRLPTLCGLCEGGVHLLRSRVCPPGHLLDFLQ